MPLIIDKLLVADGYGGEDSITSLTIALRQATKFTNAMWS